jgi:hypothetical protein
MASSRCRHVNARRNKQLPNALHLLDAVSCGTRNYSTEDILVAKDACDAGRLVAALSAAVGIIAAGTRRTTMHATRNAANSRCRGDQDFIG